MNKKIALPLLGIVAAGIFGMSVINARAETATDPQTSIISKLASRFNLKESDVKTVFDESRAEHQTAMKTAYEQRLAQAVTDGKITEAQKKLLVDKHSELQLARESDRETLRSLTPEQRQKQMTDQRNNLELWAKDNGIDPQYLTLGENMGNGGKHGFGMGKNF